MGNLLTIQRQFNNGKRLNKAWWHCKMTDSGQWDVHFFADYVPTEDHIIDDVNLFEAISEQHKRWIVAMEARAK